MRSFSTKKRISAALSIAALVFSLTAPSILLAYGCGCADELTAPVETSFAVPAACCCAGGCAPMPASAPQPVRVDTHKSCETHPVCCCAPPVTPPATGNQSFLKDERRPSLPESQFQRMLPSAFMPPPGDPVFRSILAFDVDIGQLSIHIPSTILLL